MKMEIIKLLDRATKMQLKIIYRITKKIVK